MDSKPLPMDVTPCTRCGAPLQVWQSQIPTDDGARHKSCSPDAPYFQPEYDGIEDALNGRR